MASGHMEIDDIDESLLSCVRSLVEVERELNTVLTKSQALLQTRSTQFDCSNPPLLPTPTTMSQIETILALARTYSSRTSAPAGWNPTLPVVTFATPNPLPHQLRGGALGAMQLKMARKMKRRDEEERKQQLDKEKNEKEEGERQKRMKVEENEKLKESTGKSEGKTSATGNSLGGSKEQDKNKKLNTHANQNAYQKKKPVVATTMNLSSSDSSSDDDDSSDSDSE